MQCFDKGQINITHTDNKECNGYFTVEASFILPMVLAIFVIIIHSAYMLYGKCLLTQDTYILCFRASILSEDNNMTPVNYIYSHKDKQFGNRYIGNKKPKISVAQSGKTIKATAETEANHNAMGRFFLIPQNGYETKAVAKVVIQENARHIRKLTRVKDIAAGISNRKDRKKKE